MREQRPKTRSVGFQHAVTSAAQFWSPMPTRRVVSTAVSITLSVALAACGGGGGSDSTANDTPSTSAAKSSTIPLAMSLKMNTTGLTQDQPVDRFIVKYKTGSAERKAVSAVQARLDRLGSAFPSRAHHFRRLGVGADLIQSERKLNAADAKAFMRAMASDPNVEYVEPDTAMSIGSAPDDPMYVNGSQWALGSNLVPGVKTAGIRAAGAWTYSIGEGVVIGVIDSGITSHSDLNWNVLPGYEFTSGTYGNRGGDGTQPANKPGENCNTMWHGTHVAGIMAATTNNNVGMAGIAPHAKLVSVRTVGNCYGGVMSDMADGITWAAGGTVADAPVNPNPAKVINISLYGWGVCQRSLQDAIDYATSKGSVVVVIAGNYSTDASKVQPANCRNVITVGAINSNSTKWTSSDFGPTVDIAAPGSSIWSLYNNGKTSPGTEGYNQLDGTSQAAPMVSGVVALVQSIAPKPLTVAEMRTLIQQTAQPFTPSKPDQPIGPGVVDATAAVMAARSGKIPAAAEFNCIQSQQLMQLTCTDLSTARGGIPIRSWRWDFGDRKGATVYTSSVNPVVNYDYPGTYQITLTTTDANGAESTTSLPFSIFPLAVADITDDYYGVRIAPTLGDMLYFSVTAPPSTVKSPDHALPGSITTFTLKSRSSKDIATLDVRGDTPTMTSPDCTSTMSGGVPATCTVNASSGGRTWYAKVTAKTAIDDAIISQFIASELNPTCRMTDNCTATVPSN